MKNPLNDAHLPRVMLWPARTATMPRFAPLPSDGTEGLTDEEPPVDLHRLQNMVTGDGEKLIELVGEYLDEEAKLLHHLRQAISAGSARDMKWCAHKLGGLSATCGMSAIVIPLARLERNDEELVSSVHRDLLAEAERQSKRILAFLVSRNLTPDNSHLNEEYQP